MSSNPYQSPLATDLLNPAIGATTSDELARRFTRFAAALLDGLIGMAVVVPVQFATGTYQRMMANQASILEQILMIPVGVITLLVFHGYFLATRGQTIGKLATGIQIVDANSGQLLPFFRVFFLRYLWLFPLVILTALIPGQTDGLIVNAASLIDAVLIFGNERRCLHDYIAGSKVVLYREGRNHMD